MRDGGRGGEAQRGAGGDFVGGGRAGAGGELVAADLVGGYLGGFCEFWVGMVVVVQCWEEKGREGRGEEEDTYISNRPIRLEVRRLPHILPLPRGLAIRDQSRERIMSGCRRGEEKTDKALHRVLGKEGKG